MTWIFLSSNGEKAVYVRVYQSKFNFIRIILLKPVLPFQNYLRLFLGLVGSLFPTESAKAPSTRAIFMWKFLFARRVDEQSWPTFVWQLHLLKNWRVRFYVANKNCNIQKIDQFRILSCCWLPMTTDPFIYSLSLNMKLNIPMSMLVYTISNCVYCWRCDFSPSLTSIFEYLKPKRG